MKIKPKDHVCAPRLAELSTLVRSGLEFGNWILGGLWFLSLRFTYILENKNFDLAHSKMGRSVTWFKLKIWFVLIWNKSVVLIQIRSLNFLDLGATPSDSFLSKKNWTSICTELSNLEILYTNCGTAHVFHHA